MEPLRSTEFYGLRKVMEIRFWRNVFLEPDHLRSYRDLVIRASEHCRLRVLFARRKGEDLAYVMGGVLGKSHCGFQMGYDQSYAQFGLGNHTQIQMIQRLADEGVEFYDLEMRIDYKMRWEDRTLQLLNLLVVPS